MDPMKGFDPPHKPLPPPPVMRNTANVGNMANNQHAQSNRIVWPETGAWVGGYQPATRRANDHLDEIEHSSLFSEVRIAMIKYAAARTRFIRCTNSSTRRADHISTHDGEAEDHLTSWSSALTQNAMALYRNSAIAYTQSIDSPPPSKPLPGVPTTSRQGSNASSRQAFAGQQRNSLPEAAAHPSYTGHLPHSAQGAPSIGENGWNASHLESRAHPASYEMQGTSDPRMQRSSVVKHSEPRLGDVGNSAGRDGHTDSAQAHMLSPRSRGFSSPPQSLSPGAGSPYLSRQATKEWTEKSRELSPVTLPERIHDALRTTGNQDDIDLREVRAMREALDDILRRYEESLPSHQRPHTEATIAERTGRISQGSAALQRNGDAAELVAHTGMLNQAAAAFPTSRETSALDARVRRNLAAAVGMQGALNKGSVPGTMGQGDWRDTHVPSSEAGPARAQRPQPLLPPCEL